MRKRVILATCLLAAFAAASMATAATPPPFLNYQGVLRDANGVPITGTRDMTFRFFDDPNAGSEILVDSHTGSGTVAVDGGLFNVTLGGGVVTDGAGTGTYTDLGAVSRDYGQVWLQIQVAGEVLSPRVQVVSAPYALNAANLAGKAASQFIDTSSVTQTKSGNLTVNDLMVSGNTLNLGNGSRLEDDGTSLYLIGRSSLSTQGISLMARPGGGTALIGNTGEFRLSTDGGIGTHFKVFDDGEVYIYGGVSFVTPPLTGGQIAADSNGFDSNLYVRAGGTPYGRLSLSAGPDPNLASISIRGSGSLDITAGNGSVSFSNGLSGQSTAGLNGSGNLWIAGAFTADGLGVGEATLASGNQGIVARGTYGSGDSGEAGKFCDTGYSGEAELADGNTGVVGSGFYAGGIFTHRLTEDANCTQMIYTNAVYLATSTSAIESAAPKNFVQNHPYDSTKLVVYTSLEGDEVGTYTRGVARLQGGIARVPLGETFAWVTNPGIGLTTHVTPRGEWNDLYVESVTTKELVVRSRDGAGDGAFDYIVHGLRVGFEQASVVRERDVDAYIPPMAPHEELYAREPALRSLSAGERFKAMHESAGESIDLDGGRALAAAIGVYDPAVHGVPRTQLLGGPIASAPVAHSEPPIGAASPAEPPSAGEATAPTPAVVAAGGTDPGSARSGGMDPCRGVTGCALFVVDERIEAGELLTLDPLRVVELALATKPADPGVVGVALGSAVDADGRRLVPVLSSGFAEVRVDAGYGSIRAGDLLTASPTPGHAMRSEEAKPGTIVGKALESLEAGTGLIRVLVMMR